MQKFTLSVWECLVMVSSIAPLAEAVWPPSTSWEKSVCSPALGASFVLGVVVGITGGVLFRKR